MPHTTAPGIRAMHGVTLTKMAAVLMMLTCVCAHVGAEQTDAASRGVVARIRP